MAFLPPEVDQEPDELMIEGPFELEGQPPIALEGEELKEFLSDFRTELYLAEGRSIREEELRRWRDYYHLRKPHPPYEGAPSHTLPVVRGKVRGFVSHAWKSLHRDPFFIMRTYSEKAGEVRNSLETLMERELDKVNAQRQFKLATKESGLTGTCFLGVSVIPDPNNEVPWRWARPGSRS